MPFLQLTRPFTQGSGFILSHEVLIVSDKNAITLCKHPAQYDIAAPRGDGLYICLYVYMYICSRFTKNACWQATGEAWLELHFFRKFAGSDCRAVSKHQPDFHRNQRA